MMNTEMTSREILDTFLVLFITLPRLAYRVAFPSFLSVREGLILNVDNLGKVRPVRWASPIATGFLNM